MKQKIKLRVLAWILIVSFIVSGATPVSAKADVVEDFTPRRIMIKRDETAGEDYSVSFFARYEPAEETVITEGLTVMDAGMYDLYDLYFDQSVVAVEDDAPLFATGEIVAEADRLMELTGIDSLQEQGYYGYGVKVAVLDTAVEKINGIHLAGEVSFISEEQQKVESGEPLLHGTAVASVLSELVPMAELYSVEVLDETGNGYYSSLIQGIYWAVEQNMDVLVLSLGGETYSAFLQEALQLAAWHDIVVLAAAGNEDGGTILYPAAYQEVLSVGAADSVGQPIISYAGGTTPDLLAPGETGVTADNRAMVFRGSSAATPVAAAGAVLLRSMDSALSREQVMALLLNTSDTIVDIEAAVENRTSPVYTRLTNRTASAELLEGQEEALDGVLEAQSTDSHICSFNTTYGPHTANGHQCIITCRYCDFLVIQGGVYLADCESCVSNPSSPDVTPEPTPEPTPTPLPVRYDTTLVNGTLGGEDTANTTSNGDPVNMVTGNFYLNITDMYYQGIGDAAIAITRHYNSVDTRSGLLGKGWRFAYESKLTKKTGGDMEAVYSSGRTILFDKKGSSYIAPDACRDTLTKNADGTWCLVTEDKLTYTYSSAGKLTAITDRNGNSVTLTYSSGTLTGITGADGITLSVTCSGGKLRKITDPYGRTVEYSYDSKGRLIKVSGETCGTMTYTYNSYGITSITDGNGETYIKNKYDSMGRVIRQTDADGRQYKFQYNDDAQENTFPNSILVFGMEYNGDTSKFPKDTTLQRNFINYLNDGKKCGFGHGIIIFDGENIVNKPQIR